MQPSAEGRTEVQGIDSYPTYPPMKDGGSRSCGSILYPIPQEPDPQKELSREPLRAQPKCVKILQESKEDDDQKDQYRSLAFEDIAPFDSGGVEFMSNKLTSKFKSTAMFRSRATVFTTSTDNNGRKNLADKVNMIRAIVDSDPARKGLVCMDDDECTEDGFAAVNEMLASESIHFLWAQFKNKNLEKEFHLYINRHSRKLNISLLLLAMLAFFVYAFSVALLQKVIIEDLVYQASVVVTFGLFALLVAFLPSFIMDRIQRPLTTLGILVVYFESLIWFLRGIDDKVQAAKDSNSRVFETYVSATFVVMIYFSICLASQSLISGFIIASLVSFLVWLSVAFTIPVRNPFEVSSLLSFYGFVSVTALLQLRNQEFRYRRIFQLEKFLANRVNIHICDVVTKPTAELTTFILDKAQIKRRGVLAKAEALDLPKSNLINFSSSWNNNFARAQTFINTQLLVVLDDPARVEVYSAWRHSQFIWLCRINLILQILTDTTSAFLDVFSYCDKHEVGSSPSLCGQKGNSIRTARLAIAGVLIVATILSFAPLISKNPNAAQGVLAGSQTIRGLGYIFLFWHITVWNPTDGTNILMNSFLLNSVFTSVGPCALTMKMYFTEALSLFIGGFAGKLILKAPAGGYLFTFLIIALPVGAAYNILMERIEQRLFTLREIGGRLLMHDAWIEEHCEIPKNTAETAETAEPFASGKKVFPSPTE